MPNTIAHLGLNALFSKAFIKNADIKWIYVGAVLPDVPYILKRAILMLFPDVNVLDVRLFAIVQASLLFSLVFAFACSRFSNRANHVFLVLSVGVLLHLLLDACQIKWGNGPNFFAPFDWTIVNFGFFWPEQLPSHLLTALGGLYAIYAFTVPVGGQSQDLAIPKKRGLVAFWIALAIYVMLPFAFMNSVEKAGGGDVQLIRMADRTGRFMEMDRAPFKHSGDLTAIQLYAGQFITLTGIAEGLPNQGKISIRGSFVAHDIFQADEYHLNDGAFREIASIVGLSIVLIYWLIVLIGRFRTIGLSH
jgi:hypothetical protein